MDLPDNYIKVCDCRFSCGVIAPKVPERHHHDADFLTAIVGLMVVLFVLVHLDWKPKRR